MSTLHSLKWVRIPLDFCHFPSLLRRLPNDCHPGKYLDVCTLHSSDRFRMLHIMIAEMQKPLFNNCYDFGCECQKNWNIVTIRRNHRILRIQIWSYECTKIVSLDWIVNNNLLWISGRGSSAHSLFFQKIWIRKCVRLITKTSFTSG